MFVVLFCFIFAFGTNKHYGFKENGSSWQRIYIYILLCYTYIQMGCWDMCGTIESWCFMTPVINPSLLLGNFMRSKAFKEIVCKLEASFFSLGFWWWVLRIKINDKEGGERAGYTIFGSVFRSMLKSTLFCLETNPKLNGCCIVCWRTIWCVEF